MTSQVCQQRKDKRFQAEDISSTRVKSSTAEVFICEIAGSVEGLGCRKTGYNKNDSERLAEAMSRIICLILEKLNCAKTREGL